MIKPSLRRLRRKQLLNPCMIKQTIKQNTTSVHRLVMPFDHRMVLAAAVRWFVRVNECIKRLLEKRLTFLGRFWHKVTFPWLWIWWLNEIWDSLWDLDLLVVLILYLLLVLCLVDGLQNGWSWDAFKFPHAGILGHHFSNTKCAASLSILPHPEIFLGRAASFRRVDSRVIEPGSIQPRIVDSRGV